MTVSEKVAYLKGLAEGLALDTETKEGKLISVIIDTLEDIALELEELNENALDIGDELDALSDDLSDVEEVLFGDDDDEDEEEDEDDEDSCGCGDEDCCCGGDDEECAYEVTCPSCGEDIIIEEADLENGSITCPKCGEKLEFEFDEDDEAEEEAKKDTD
jgi:DNA-directed RNA polymerase subunit RPC12/RpoP